MQIFPTLHPFFIDILNMGKVQNKIVQDTPQKKKKKFRESAKWKSFRRRMKDKQNNTDLITNKKLYKGFTVHHLDMDFSHYENITDESHFLACNKKTHEVIHWLWTYYQTDPSIITRLESILISMSEINAKDNSSCTYTQEI